MEQTAHTPIRARRKDGYMRLLAVAGPILSDVMLKAHKTQTRILSIIPLTQMYYYYDTFLCFLFQCS